jgi:ferrous iron transport protein A
MLKGLRIGRRSLVRRGTANVNGALKQLPRELLTLTDLKAGESARIACLVCERAGRCERLLAYGLVEGQTVTLLQKNPAYVIRVDETELALDEEVARCVRVVV